jgi:C-terminal peptidase prc
MIGGFLVCLAAGPLWAANPSGTAPAVAPHVKAQAQSYAAQVMSAVDYIHRNYVREVKEVAIVEAAIQGLYETAREPLPAGLKTDLERARTRADWELILISAREHLGDPDELRDNKSLLISLKAIPRVLDPYSGIPSAAEARRGMGNADEVQLVVGLELESAFDNSPLITEDDILPRGRMPRPAVRNGPFRVVNVVPGSPAQRAGVKPGDLLTHIDDKLLEGPPVAALLQRLLQGGDGNGSKIAFTLTRSGQPKPLRIEVTPTPFTPESVFGVKRNPDNTWNYMLDPVKKIGYVRLGFIDSSAPQEMTDALRELQVSGMRGLILDLRGNPGGYVDPATQVVSKFVASGDIAIINYRVADESRGTPQQQRYQADGSATSFGDFPLVVIVNQDTMGGGEMIASALQDHKRGVLVGQRTFGKGSVQHSQAIAGVNISFKMTTGMFSRPNGKNLQRFPDSKLTDDWGVKPNPGMDFPVSAGVNKRLKDWMQWQILRPGDDRELLPLDDPENDPQREFARKQLLKMIK